MAEFRTRMSGSESDAGGGGLDLEGHLESVIENIKNDPKVKLQIAQRLEESGIDPVILDAILPEGVSSEDLREARRAQQQVQAQQQVPQQAQQAQPKPESQTEVVEVEKELDTDDLLEFVDEIIDIAPDGEEMTLGDLREFGGDNPDVVQTAIDMKL